MGDVSPQARAERSEARDRTRTPTSAVVLQGGEQGFATTRVDALLGWARKYSLFAYPFVTACCGMEFMALNSPRFDLARFGAEAPRFSPRQSDLLWVVGTISQRQAPVLKRIYEQMMEPKWVLAFGTCASSGGFYDNYTTLPGTDKIIPTDVYVPGCPPRPEAVLDGLMLLQDKIARGDRRPGVVKPRVDPPHQVQELVQLRRSARDPSELAARLAGSAASRAQGAGGGPGERPRSPGEHPSQRARASGAAEERGGGASAHVERPDPSKGTEA